MHLNSELLFRKYAAPIFRDFQRVLEIGPTGFPSAYQRIVNKETIKWDTVDFADTKYIGTANQFLTYPISNPYVFPIENDKYDIVLSGQVIEHVEKLWIWINELKRVTTNGGIIIIINPVSWPYHEAPLDCWRIFPSGVKALADEAHLEVILSLFESLEKEELRTKDSSLNFIPGKSYNYEKKISEVNKKIAWNKFIRKIPFLSKLEIPIEVSFDTISILRK